MGGLAAPGAVLLADVPVPLGLLVVALLIGLNGLCVAAEFAYVAVRRPPLEDAARKGDRRAARALGVSSKLSFMLSGAQLGITATSLLVGFIAEPTLGRAITPLVLAVGLPEPRAATVALGIGFILATATQMVLGELAPKNLAIARAEGVAKGLGAVTLVALTVFGPLIRFFDEAANKLLRAIGIEPAEELEAGVSAEELAFIVAASSEGGTLEPAQAALLGRTLEFRNLTVADAMVPRTRIVALGVSASCAELEATAVRTGHSRFPVHGEDLDDVIGVVQAKDVLAIPHASRPDTSIRDLISDAAVVPEQSRLSALLDELRTARTPLALVIDEHGGVAGLVTLEDVVEELFGEISDEHDRGEMGLRKHPDGSFTVPGSWRPDEVTREAGVELPEGDYETVSGLIMDRLGRLPAPGDTVQVDGVRLEVLRLEGHAVATARVTPAPVAEDET